MIFSELYSAYYNAVACVLREATKRQLQRAELRELIEKYAFGESVLTIEPALTEQRWPLLYADGTTPLQHAPQMPLTNLEKRWLNAIYADPRIRLFTDEAVPFEGVEPLFRQEDVCVFDRYADGDPYTDEGYIQRFRMILTAIREQVPLSLDTRNRYGNILHLVLLPEYLEYSEKDDKFRLIGSGRRTGATVNLARIVKCSLVDHPLGVKAMRKARTERRTVQFELVDERNALERVLMHFAHFEKQAEKLESRRYRVTVAYDRLDETEMVIRLLSFGPMVKVTGPESFVKQIRERLKKQKSCEQ